MYRRIFVRGIAIHSDQGSVEELLIVMNIIRRRQD
jgi:hypothetical protein